MSSVYLLKDRGRDKKGSIVSVPFSLGRQMIAEGAALYPADVPPEQPKVEPVPEPVKPAKV